MANNTATPKKEGKFESVKKLNAIFQSGEPLSLVSDFKDLRLKIDTLIKSEKIKAQQIKQKKAEIERKEEEKQSETRIEKRGRNQTATRRDRKTGEADRSSRCLKRACCADKTRKTSKVHNKDGTTKVRNKDKDDR